MATLTTSEVITINGIVFIVVQRVEDQITIRPLDNVMAECQRFKEGLKDILHHSKAAVDPIKFRVRVQECAEASLTGKVTDAAN